MRIAMLYDMAYPFVKGGGQKRLFEISRRLVQKGHEVSWWALKSWTGNDVETIDGIEYHAVGSMLPLYTNTGRRTIGEALHYALSLLQHSGWRKADLIHCGVFPFLHLPVVLCLAKERSRRVSVDWWEVWGDHWREYLGYPGIIGQAIEKFLLQHTRNLVAISPMGARQLSELVRPGSHIELIHNGIDFAAIDAAPVVSGAPYDLAYAGRLKKHKNVAILVRSLAVLGESGFRPTLEILGDGPERVALESLTRELGLGGQVSFIGEIETEQEMYGRLKAAQVFVNPSTKEGGGSITILEANACGLPVVVFRHDLGVDPSLVEEGQTGFWVGDISPEALAAKLQEVLADAERLARLRPLCRQAARARDWSFAAEHYERFFGSRLPQLHTA